MFAKWDETRMSNDALHCARSRDVDLEELAHTRGSGREDQDPVTHGYRLFDRVRDEHHRPGRELVDAEQLVLEDLARQSVERAEGLVHEQDVWLDRESAREASALLHAAR